MPSTRPPFAAAARLLVYTPSLEVAAHLAYRRRHGHGYAQTEAHEGEQGTGPKMVVQQQAQPKAPADEKGRRDPHRQQVEKARGRLLLHLS